MPVGPERLPVVPRSLEHPQPVQLLRVEGQGTRQDNVESAAGERREVGGEDPVFRLDGVVSGGLLRGPGGKKRRVGGSVHVHNPLFLDFREASSVKQEEDSLFSHVGIGHVGNGHTAEEELDHVSVFGAKSVNDLAQVVVLRDQRKRSHQGIGRGARDLPVLPAIDGVQGVDDHSHLFLVWG